MAGNSNTIQHGAATARELTGKEKLEHLKARFFSPETKAERVARALEALQRAVKKSRSDIETVKYIAQDVDLEGF